MGQRPQHQNVPSLRAPEVEKACLLRTAVDLTESDLANKHQQDTIPMNKQEKKNG
jgi:hypothetical protein